MKKTIGVCALMGLIMSGAVMAEGLGVGVKAGTLGLGVEATKGLSERLNLRFGVNAFNYDFDETASGIRYDAEINLRTGAVLLDWHPFAGTFRVTAGAVYNKNEVDLKATPTTSQTIGNTTYNTSQIGTITGDVKFNTFAPYLGVGWGNAVREGSRLGINFEIGALYQGKGDVTLRGGSAITEADLRREEQEAENDLDDFKIYPVISLGLSYRF